MVASLSVHCSIDKKHLAVLEHVFYYEEKWTGTFCLQKVGFFNQQYADQLNMEETATEYLMRNFNLPYQDGRKCLGRFGLESHAHTIQISKLSGENTNGRMFPVRCPDGDIY